MADELFKNVGKDAPDTETKAAEETAEAPKEETSEEAASTSGSNAEGDAALKEQAQQPSELDMLKSRAKLMGITFSNNIGLDALKTKIEEHKQASEANTQTQATAQTNEQQPEVQTENQKKKAKTLSLRAHLQKEKMKLVRLRITNLDPKKKDLPGEILTTGNEYLGTVRKFVPFGEATDNGYHVPYCLYEMMRDRKFLSIKTRKGPKGQTIVEQQMVREFALEILPPLTEAELARLSAAQLSAGGVE